MKKSTILALIDKHLEFEDEQGFITFANAVEKQARAELIAEMQKSVVGFVAPKDIELLQQGWGGIRLTSGQEFPHMLPENDRVPLVRIPKD